MSHGCVISALRAVAERDIAKLCGLFANREKLPLTHPQVQTIRKCQGVRWFAMPLCILFAAHAYLISPPLEIIRASTAALPRSCSN